MKKIITLLAVVLFIGFSAKAQVGIGTLTPNSETMLHVESTTGGILIPRLTDAQRDANLEDNDPGSPVLNGNLQVGTLIFNTDANSFQYWNGTTWDAFAVSAGGGGSNDGAVRLDGQNGSAADKPSYVIGSGTAWQTVDYDGTLVFAGPPTTTWPETQPAGAASFYDNDGPANTPGDARFLENNVVGQVQIWRVNISWTKGGNASGGLECRIFNPASGFETVASAVVPGTGAGTSTFILFTIADNASIGTGYQIQLRHQLSQTTTMTVQNIARFSLFKN